MRVTLVAILALLPLGGCLGGEARTEWAFEVTQLSELAGDGRTGKGVIVAVLDTGINPSHVALRHLFDGDRANGEVIAFKDYVHGRDGVANAYDDDGHGSHVSGIIAASGSSLGDKLVYGGIDLLGGSPGVLMVVAKVCGSEDCAASKIPDAVRWAVAQRAQVLSMSFGGERALARLSGLNTDELEDAIQDAIDGGVVAVAAAGNEGPGNADISEPGDIPGVIAVGAVQADGAVWSNSSRGYDINDPCIVPVLPALPKIPSGRCYPHQKPEIVAPGVDILSAWTEDKYVRATGTSQATPFVTAAIALMLEGRGRLDSAGDVEDLKCVLVGAAKPVPGQEVPHDAAAGYGLLQAKKAYENYTGGGSCMKGATRQ